MRKNYITPQSEVNCLEADVILATVGPASLPSQGFMPRKRWTDVF